MKDSVVISAALTGVLATRDQCPAIPYTPREIAEEAKRAADAGAAIVHIHARTPEGGPEWRVETFAEILSEVRSRSDVIVNFSTGAIGVPVEQRIAHIRELMPEIGALNMGSMNYAIYSEKKKVFYHDHVFANPFKDIQFFLEAMNEAGVRPELECFDAGHIGNTAPLIDTIRAQINPYLAAGWAMIDDVIDPAETRRVIVTGIEQARDKKIERPWRKHGNMPV